MRQTWLVLLLGISLCSCRGDEGTSSPDTRDVVDAAGAVELDVADTLMPDLVDREVGDSLAETHDGLLDTNLETDQPEQADLAPILAGFDQPCLEDEDCESGRCLFGDLGIARCTASCEAGDCPALWDCRERSGHQLCIPARRKSCSPCYAECNSDWAACLGLSTEERVCLVQCFSQDDCPAGSECRPALDGLDRCVPETGSCRCGADEAGQMRSCEVSNEHGACPGMQECLGDTGWSDCDAATPAEEVCDGEDNDCDGAVDEGFPDTDQDDLPDLLDDDDDNDGVLDINDNCPLYPNPNQADFDEDGQGDFCDPECLAFCNPDLLPENPVELCDGIDNDCDCQIDEDFPDTDEDGLLDCMEDDDDNDGILDEVDNCPLNYNPGQADENGDGEGDACDGDDTDNDNYPDWLDCEPGNPSVNPGSPENCDGKDNNCNGQIDEGFPDPDGDGNHCEGDEADNDQIPDEEDNCPNVTNPDQADLDQDYLGDACDDDDDGDGVDDPEDNCPMTNNPNQEDLDGDGSGDACDSDDDADGLGDSQDNCPLAANPDQADMDQDGIGDECDDDNDNDLVPNDEDNCPLTWNDCQVDQDGDGLGDACDPDDCSQIYCLPDGGIAIITGDCDGILPDQDNCPEDYNPDQADADADGIGDACDP